jgi:hypothetical protein
MIGAKTISFSGSQFCFIVKALHNTTGKLSFGPEPVKQKLPMLSQLALGSPGLSKRLFGEEK